MKRRLIAILLAVLLMASCAVPALAAAPKVKSVDYEGKGVVEVEFNSENVRYKNAKVVVKNSAGKRMTVTILEKDKDDISFKVKGLEPGAQYRFTISGVRKGTSGSYGKVTGSFWVPSEKPEFKKVEYDAEDRELEVEFATRVQFKNLKVVVKDENGKKLTVSKVKTGRDDVEMKVKGIKVGETYTVIVSGVRVYGKGQYIRVSGAFVA